MEYYSVVRSSELYHHGILGMKWGVRRYQNPDGSLTPAGERRYRGLSGEGEYKAASKYKPNYRYGTREYSNYKWNANHKYGYPIARREEYRVREKGMSRREANKISEEERAAINKKAKKATRAYQTAAVVALAGSAVVGGYLAKRGYLKLNNLVVSQYGAENGLNVIKGGFSLNPGQAIERGEKLAKAMLRKGMDYRYII